MEHQVTIMLVEDEVIIALNLSQKLTRAGYHVLPIATTGEAAVQRVEQESPDIILMDTRLAGKLDGIETAQQIHTQRSIPIVLITGYPQDDAFLLRARKISPVAILEKPVTVPQIQQIIESIFTA